MGEREWLPISEYPMTGPVIEVEVRMRNNRTYPSAHYACGDGDGFQPAFSGWFIPAGEHSYVGIETPVAFRYHPPATAAGAPEGQS